MFILRFLLFIIPPPLRERILKLLRGRAPGLHGLLIRWRTIYHLLGPDIRRQVFFSQFLTLIQSVANLASLVSIVPFLSIVVTPDRVVRNPIIQVLAGWVGSEDPRFLTLVLGIISLSTLIFYHGVSYYLHIYHSRLGEQLRLIFVNRMVEYYLTAPYERHLRSNTAELMHNIMQKAMTAIGLLLDHLFGLFSMLFSIGILLLALAIKDFSLLLVSLLLSGGMLWFQIRRTRVPLTQQAHRSVRLAGTVQKKVHDALRSFEGIRISGQERFFIDDIRRQMQENIAVKRKTMVISMGFKPMSEIILYGTVILLTLFTLYFSGNQVSLSSLALFGLVSYRLLPALNNLYQRYIGLKGNIATYDFIRDDLLLAFTRSRYHRDPRRLAFENALELENISYTYPNADRLAVDDVNLTIKKGKRVGFCGPSGSGKSTLLKNMMGLLQPDSGVMRVDGQLIGAEEVPRWQNLIGYVPQNIYLLDDTIRHNIAIATPEDEIDDERIRETLANTGMLEFVESLPMGINTEIGENGIRLSGGQRQRIMIARALYPNPEVVIFDEATSAVDTATEREIINVLMKASADHTLIMVTHRISTISGCDEVFYMKDARLSDSGTYDELLKKNPDFRNLAVEESKDEEMEERQKEKQRKGEREAAASS